MKYRRSLPQLSGRIFITDGGIETTLIFQEDIPLRHFAAFDLLKTPKGTEALKKYFRVYAALAQKYKVGLILESATWRASLDWGTKLGYTLDETAAANRQSIAMLVEIRKQYESPQTPMVISGCIGPRGDGYVPSEKMSVEEARRYHAFQIEIFRTTEADLVSAITMNYPEEAIGIALAARDATMPAAISFTVETDGRLPTGQTLQSAIEETDRATASSPAYYMINCAHPSHFRKLLESKAPWVSRIRGIRANASRKSHAELNESTTLDDGDPVEFGKDYKNLRKTLETLTVLGGCCGTDHRHIEAICKELMTSN